MNTMAMTTTPATSSAFTAAPQSPPLVFRLTEANPTTTSPPGNSVATKMEEESKTKTKPLRKNKKKKPIKIIIGDMETFTRDRRWTTYRRNTEPIPNVLAMKKTKKSAAALKKKTRPVMKKKATALTKKTTKKTVVVSTSNNKQKKQEKTVVKKDAASRKKTLQRRRQRQRKALKKQVNALELCFQNMSMVSNTAPQAPQTPPLFLTPPTTSTVTA